jgi:hypothetical protein
MVMFNPGAYADPQALERARRFGLPPIMIPPVKLELLVLDLPPSLGQM